MAKEVTEELKQRLVDLRVKGLGFKKIAEQISLEFPHQYSHMWVKRYFDKHDDELAKVISEDTTIRDGYRKEIERTSKELDRIEKELWSVYGECESVREKTGVLKVLLEKVRTTQAQQKKITDNINKSTTVNILNVSEQIDKMTPEALKKMWQQKEKEKLEEYA